MSSRPADRRHPPGRSTGKDPEPLAKEAKQILRAVMERHDFSYKQLAQAFGAEAGGPLRQSVQALINKVNRGRFSFAFFLRACHAMGVLAVDVSALPPAPEPRADRTSRSTGSRVKR
jgi:hypothetical protein